jgi:long-chain acyl-CoA synthetase
LENIFLKSPFVAQIYVHGDSLQSELVGVIVPDQEFSINFAIKEGILPANTVVPPPPAPNQKLDPLVALLAQDPKFQEAVYKDLIKVGKADKIRGFEFLKAIHLESDLFTAESGLLTPTFKVKRNVAGERFRPVIDKMYKALDANRPPAKL